MSRLRRLMDVLFLDGFRAAPQLMWATLALTLLNGIGHALFPLGFKLTIDSAIERNQTGLAFGVFVTGALIVISWFCATMDANVGFGLMDRMDLFVSTSLLRKITSTASVRHLEDPDYLRHLDLLVERRFLLRSGPRQTLNAISSVVRGLAMVILLASVLPVLALLPLLCIVPFYAQSRAVRFREQAEDAVAEDRRLAQDLFELSISRQAAKELRIYQLSEFLHHRHEVLMRTIDQTIERAARRGAVLYSAGSLVFVTGFAAGFALVLKHAIDGQATVGDIVIAAVLAQQVQKLVSSLANDLATLMTTAKTASRLILIDDFSASDRAALRSEEPPTQLKDGIRFIDVKFRYPGSETDVLRGIDLFLPAGSSVALLGANGSGKTTLVKLLSAIHEPTSGRILIDNRDLHDIDIAAWRARTAAAFQDFAQFELLAQSCVGVGDLPRIEDSAAVLEALERAGAVSMVQSWPEGLMTPLGSSFERGRDISGGQWQKIAVARAFMRRSPLVLFLDEPTASLDPEAEDALFHRYFAAAAHAARDIGAIAVFVTHRSSTVRTADLIVTLADGQVSEIGTHAELLAACGDYAELFRLQAEAYEDR